jgi:hypothetical protein
MPGVLPRDTARFMLVLRDLGPAVHEEYFVRFTTDSDRVVVVGFLVSNSVSSLPLAYLCFGTPLFFVLLRAGRLCVQRGIGLKRSACCAMQQPAAAA